MCGGITWGGERDMSCPAAVKGGGGHDGYGATGVKSLIAKHMNEGREEYQGYERGEGGIPRVGY